MEFIPKEKIEELIQHVLDQANYFLIQAGEFYPFGVVLDANDDFRNINIDSDNDFPHAIEVLQKLEDGIKGEIRNGTFFTGALGVNVNIKTKTNIGEVICDGIEVRVYDENSYDSYQFLFYKEDEKYDIRPYSFVPKK